MKNHSLMQVEDNLFTKEMLSNLSESFPVPEYINVCLLEDEIDADEVIKRKHIATFSKQSQISPEAQSHYMQDWYLEILEFYNDNEYPISKYLWDRYLSSKEGSSRIGVKINKKNKPHKLKYISEPRIVRKNIEKLAYYIYQGPRGQVSAQYMNNLLKKIFPKPAPINGGFDFGPTINTSPNPKPHQGGKGGGFKPSPPTNITKPSIKYGGIKDKSSFKIKLDEWIKLVALNNENRDTSLYNVLKDLEILNNNDLLNINHSYRLKFISHASIRLFFDCIALLVLEKPNLTGTNLNTLVKTLSKMRNQDLIELNMSSYQNYNDLNDYAHGRINTSKEHNFYTEFGKYEKLFDFLIIDYISQNKKIPDINSF